MQIQELNHQNVLDILPDRKPDSHKGNYGRVLLLCGSMGYTGAAALAAMGALRSGAGLVYLGVPSCIYEIEAIKLTEAIVFPLSDEDGSLSVEAIPEILKKSEQMDAVLIGPGLGNNKSTFTVIKTILAHYSGPVVLDADGINVLAGHIDILRDRTGVTILTPHDGEFSRIGGDLHADRIEASAAFARENGIILLRKGHHSIITDGGNCYRNVTGNPGMAVGGSGDILAGMLVSLIGQGIAPIKAAACAAWLHGAAGDLCSKELGQYGMLPTDMLNVLPRLMK